MILNINNESQSSKKNALTIYNLKINYQSSEQSIVSTFMIVHNKTLIHNLIYSFPVPAKTNKIKKKKRSLVNKTLKVLDLDMLTLSVSNKIPNLFVFFISFKLTP